MEVKKGNRKIKIYERKHGSNRLAKEMKGRKKRKAKRKASTEGRYTGRKVIDRREP